MAMCALGACASAADGVGDGPDDGFDPTAVPPGLAFFAAQDTYLTAADPTASFGNSATVEVGDTGDGLDTATLIAWDLSAIPPGSPVRGVVLSIYITQSAFQRFPIYELRRDWTEADATWSGVEGEDWDGEGASGATDRGDAPLGTIEAYTTGLYAMKLNPDGRDVVQRWIDDPSTNHGFVIATAGFAEGFAFASREAANVAQRPLLSVDYAAPSSVARR
jgi:hypothetical protein